MINRDEINRRSFLKTSALLAAGGAIAARSTAAWAQEQEPERWIATLGKVRDLNEKEPVLVKASFLDAEEKVMVTEKLFVRWERINRNTGRWVVLSAICQHLKCKVEYSGEENQFICPCHGSRYSLEGDVLNPPTKKPLPDYSDDVYEEDGMLMLSRKPD